MSAAKAAGAAPLAAEAAARAGAASDASAAGDAALTRGGLFLVIFALALVGLRPFEDLRVAMPDEPVEGRDQLTYFVFAAVAAMGIWLARRYAPRALAVLVKPPFLALAAWIAVSTLISHDPATSMKRAALCMMVAATAAATPLLPRGRAEMAQWIALAAAIPIALSYFGVLFLPDLSIHSLADTTEPDLVGDWRGVFSHKNVASPVFGFLAFFGLYLVSVGRRAAGATIALLALVFLFFTHGKTSSALWLPALLMGGLAARRGAGWLWTLCALAPPLFLTAIGFGAQMFAPLQNLAAALPIDSSFTGRSDVWRLAAQKLLERPLAGRGFDSFWDDPSLRANFESGWASNAAHAHNSYVDATLSMGLIGLALTLWAFVAQPLADLRAAFQRGADPALTRLCAQIWLYGVWVCSLETFLYDRANPVWFLFLFAAFTLRYLATFPVAQ